MTTSTQAVHTEDVVGVRSRISWGALLGGATIALACSTVITFFFAAVGLSLTATDLRGDAIGIGAIVAAVATIVVSLFLGGWVTTQLTVGENRTEAVLYGVLTWAVVIAFSMCMIGMGVRAGYFALVGGTMVAQNAPAVQQRSWEDMARSAGVPAERIEAARQGIDPARAAAVDPATRDRAERAAITTAWGAFAAMLLSVAAAVGGAVCGCGPSFRLFPVVYSSRHEPLAAH